MVQGRYLLSLLVIVPLFNAHVHAAEPTPQAIAAFEAGQEAFRREDLKGAEVHFKTAIALDAGFVDPRCALGQVYMAMRRYTAAVDVLTQCKSMIQAGAAEQASVGRELDVEREMEELRESIRRIRSGEIKTANEHTVLRLEERLRTLEEGRFRTSTARGPAVPAEVSFALGTAHLRTGSLQQAERELLDAVRSRGGFGEAHNNLAAVYAGLARWDEARKHVDLAEAGGFPVSPRLKSDVAARNVVKPDGSAVARSVPTEDQPLAIEHTPVECVPSDRFPRIEARLAPAGRVVSAKVYFRSEKSGWYAVGLRPDEEAYSATLPRPRSASSFHYYLEATGDATDSARTPEYVTTVVDDREACANKTSEFLASASGLLVEPPPGRKTAPVPSGFSSKGVVGDIGQFEISTPVAVGAAAVLGGAAVAVARANSEKEFETAPAVGVPFVTGPGIAFVGSTPPPGSTLSLSSGTLTLQLQVFSPNEVPGAIITASLYEPQSSGPCYGFTTTRDLPAGRTEVVTLGGPLAAARLPCRPGVTIIQLRVAVTTSASAPLFETGQTGIPNIPVSYDLVP